MIYKLLWKYFRDGLIKEWVSESNKPTTHAMLEYAFTDMKGRKYYRYPKDMSMSLDRYSHLTKYLSYLSARLTPEQMDSIIDVALQIIQDGIGKDKNAARVAALLYELKDRDRLIVPSQLVYDILAVQYVREDEKPDEFDNEIHMDKVSTFMSDISKSSFFFQLPELIKLTNMSATSMGAWVKYLEQSAIQDANLKRILKVIFSGKGNANKEKDFRTY